ncbi:Map2 kinase [Theileria orientalis]|uniref:Mitogen-activated protein kinase n=1 Tax=Theileria orientalis TaxID=68886 RepID=A0A976M9N4_THEOR|nr:Map2 kinase [Theileria orientalis]
MTNNFLKSDKSNKQGPYDYDKYESRDSHYHDRAHQNANQNSKHKYAEYDYTADLKNYVTKQTLLHTRMSSAETDVPSNYQRKTSLGRKSSSIDNFYNGFENQNRRFIANKPNLGVTTESAGFQPETKFRPIKSTNLKKEKGSTKPIVQNGINWELGERYKFIDMVGSGSYGNVCRAYDSHENKFVAIKRIHKVFDDLIDCKRILREIAILNRLDHPNVVKILDILVPPNLETFDVLYVVLEIAASDIKQLVRSPAFLNDNHIRLLLFNLLSGVQYLHSVGIFHRDLKPANCLINRDCSVKICDFGLARTTTYLEEYVELTPTRMDSISSRQSLPGSGRLESHSAHLSNFSTSRSLPESLHTPADFATTYKDSYRGSYDSHKCKLTCYTDKSRTGRSDHHDASSNFRQLTGHVVTRWYRAPELILLQNDYSFAVDMWSVGCIFAELLNMLKVNVGEPSDRSPLFPGSCCFPLSPENKNSSSKNPRENDQLNLIFNVLGTPSDEDLTWIDKPDVQKYVRIFATRSFQDLRTRYKGSSVESLDLLKKLLTFNPAKRISVSDALNHPYFKSINRPRHNFSHAPKIILPFNDWGNMSESQLRYAFLREIQHYHKDLKIPVKIIYRS